MPVDNAVAPVGDAWLKLSNVVEVEGGGSLEAPIEVGPDLAYEANHESDDAS